MHISALARPGRCAGARPSVLLAPTVHLVVQEVWSLLGARPCAEHYENGDAIRVRRSRKSIMVKMVVFIYQGLTICQAPL